LDKDLKRFVASAVADAFLLLELRMRESAYGFYCNEIKYINKIYEK
jgi:hypothetical protein